MTNTTVARAREGPRYYSSDSICVTVLNLEPKSPNPANRFEKQIFEKKCQTWTALPDTESPPKYF